MNPSRTSSLELSDTDKSSIDLILESRLAAGPAAGQTGSARLQAACPDAPLLSTPVVPKVESVERWSRILSNLDHFEVPEPSADLVDRTLDRIDQAQYTTWQDNADSDSHLSPNLSH